MDNLLAPLEQLDDLKSEDLKPESIEKTLETKIPIPTVSHLQKISANQGNAASTTMTKYQKEYDAFCAWSALPKDLRKPKTAVEFEKKNMLPKGYTNYFKTREDFPTKRWTAFWDWMMDLYPDVVYAVYQRATNAKGSDKAASIFVDLLSKKMNLDQPRVQVQPMVLMGVPQEKIDALFVPKGYNAVIDAPEKK